MKKYFAIFSILLSLCGFGCSKNEEVKKEDKNVNGCSFMYKPQSFSFIFFEGDVKNEIIDFFRKTDYKILSKEIIVGEYKLLENELEKRKLDTPIENKNIVYKELFKYGGYTVLVDPEMVVSTFEAELAEFSKNKSVKITCATWERYSQTVMLSTISSTGITSNTELLKNKGYEGLINALTVLKIPMNEIFSEKLECELLKLSE